MREYRSEFSPEHGVWILKRVPCEVSDEAQPVPVMPTASAAKTLRLVESESEART